MNNCECIARNDSSPLGSSVGGCVLGQTMHHTEKYFHRMFYHDNVVISVQDDISLFVSTADKWTKGTLSLCHVSQICDSVAHRWAENYLFCSLSRAYHAVQRHSKGILFVLSGIHS